MNTENFTRLEMKRDIELKMKERKLDGEIISEEMMLEILKEVIDGREEELVADAKRMTEHND